MAARGTQRTKVDEDYVANLILEVVKASGGKAETISAALSGINGSTSVAHMVDLLGRIQAKKKKKTFKLPSVAEEAQAIVKALRSQLESLCAEEGKALQLLVEIPDPQTAGEVIAGRPLGEALGDINAYLGSVSNLEHIGSIAKWQATYLRGYFFSDLREALDGDDAAFFEQTRITRGWAAVAIERYLCLKEFPGLILSSIAGFSPDTLLKPLGREVLKQLAAQENAEWVGRYVRVAPAVELRLKGAIGETAVAQELTAVELIMRRLLNIDVLRSDRHVVQEVPPWHRICQPQALQKLCTISIKALELILDRDFSAEATEEDIEELQTVVARWEGDSTYGFGAAHLQTAELLKNEEGFAEFQSLLIKGIGATLEFKEAADEYAAQFLREFHPKRLPYPLCVIAQKARDHVYHFDELVDVDSAHFNWRRFLGAPSADEDEDEDEDESEAEEVDEDGLLLDLDQMMDEN